MRTNSKKEHNDKLKNMWITLKNKMDEIAEIVENKRVEGNQVIHKGL